MKVNIKRIPGVDAQHDLMWVILEGSVDGYPQVTKRHSISTAALASGDVDIHAEKQKLIADVQDRLARFQAVQQALQNL